MTHFRIVPKRDFGAGKGFLIDGAWVKSGFVVTDGRCNIMPGATWFLTVAQAMRAIRIYVEVGGDAVAFWAAVRAEDAKPVNLLDAMKARGLR
jgi:hypothetical protein